MLYEKEINNIAKDILLGNVETKFVEDFIVRDSKKKLAIITAIERFLFENIKILPESHVVSLKDDMITLTKQLCDKQ